MKNLKSTQKRKELIQNLLEQDFKELKYDDFAHYLKDIDGKYLRKRELWAERLEKVEKKKFPHYNDRIFYLCEDGRRSYSYGLPKAAIMYFTQAAEQILKNIYLKYENHSEEVYKKIEGNEDSKGMTFGQIINLFKQKKKFESNKNIKQVIPFFEKINKIRNKTFAHIKFTGLLTYEKNPMFFQFISFLKDLEKNFQEVRDYLKEKQENGLVLKELIDNQEIDLVNYQAAIEYDISYIFSDLVINCINKIHKKLDESLIDVDLLNSKKLKYFEK